MKTWAPWATLLVSSSNTRMLEQFNRYYRVARSKPQSVLKYWVPVGLSSWDDCDWDRRTTLAKTYLETNSVDQSHHASSTWRSFTFASLGSMVLATLRVPISALLANPRPCACQHFDVFGDHLQTCHHQSETLHTHWWVVCLQDQLDDLFVLLTTRETQCGPCQ